MDLDGGGLKRNINIVCTKLFTYFRIFEDLFVDYINIIIPLLVKQQNIKIHVVLLMVKICAPGINNR